MSARKRKKRRKTKSGDGRGAFTVSAVVAVAVVIGAAFALYKPFLGRGGLQGTWVVDVEATKKTFAEAEKNQKRSAGGQLLAQALGDLFLGGILQQLEIAIDASTIEIRFDLGGLSQSEKKPYTSKHLGGGRYELITPGKEGKEPDTVIATVQGDRMTWNEDGEDKELSLVRKGR